METLIGAAVVAAVVLVAAVVAVLTVRALIVIVPPNRAAVITGRTRELTSGQQIGYRSVIGGRDYRCPPATATPRVAQRQGTLTVRHDGPHRRA